MVKRRTRPAETPLNPPDVPFEQLQIELEGRRQPEDQAAFIDLSDVDTLTRTTRSDVDGGEQGEPPSTGDDLLESLDLLDSQELRAEETADPGEAVAEGYTYVPPIDPPTLPDERSGADALVASGFGLSAEDEPYDADHHGAALLDEDEIAARVREALRADSSTAAYASQVRVIARGRVVLLRGVVDDLEDGDNLVAVAADVADVDEVIDELRIRSVDGGGPRRPPQPRQLGSAADTAPAALSLLTPVELDEFRRRLEARRQELREQISDLEAQLRAGDEEAGADNAPADSATDLNSREQALGLIEALRADLGQVDRALARVAAGTYGLSELSGRPIPRERLDALPSATTLVDEPTPER
jgi:RNA polymerase-binding transcription factor DksA